MDLFAFSDRLEEEIRKQTEEPLEAEKKVILKNNGVQMDALVFRTSDSRIAPTVYLQPLYDQYLGGMPVRDIAYGVVRSLKRDMHTAWEQVENFPEYNRIRHAVYCRLVSREWNGEVIRDLCHEDWMDLAVTYYHSVSLDGQNEFCIQLRKEHLDMWNITEEQLREDAWRNTGRDLPPVISMLQQVLEELPGWSEGTEDPYPLYIISNRTRMLGAVSIAFPGELEEMARTVGGDYYILPSSIHECLLLRDDGIHTGEGLGQMVREINRSAVKPQEVLADHVYHYDRARKILTPCGFGGH